MPVARTPKRIDTPVQVLSKPAPEYTEEARARRVEGTVTLEVDFMASGEVHVVRVLQSLGYGLDEAAARAAEQVRFTPARSEGGAVDCRATVQIVFRLS